MEDLQLKQNYGTEYDGVGVEKIAANKDDSVEIPEVEKHLIHVRLESPSFNRETGARESKPWFQSFHVREFEAMEANNEFPGLKVEIVHDPRTPVTAQKNALRERIESPLSNIQVETPVDKMGKAELQRKYADLYKEEPGDKSDKELRDLIVEKIEFLRDEDAAEHARKDANEGTQSVKPAPKTAAPKGKASESEDKGATGASEKA